jgi:hypothetical protein
VAETASSNWPQDAENVFRDAEIVFSPVDSIPNAIYTFDYQLLFSKRSSED